MPPGERPEFVAALACCPQEADPDLVDAEGVGAKRPRRLFGSEDFRPAIHVAGAGHPISAALGQEPQAPGRATSIDMGNEVRPTQVGENLLSAARAAIREVDRAHLGGGEDAMLADGGKHLAGRFRDSLASACLPVHASPQGSERLTARCCGASAEPVIGCGVGVASTKAITVAEVMESRCRTSAEVVAQASVQGTRRENG